MLNKEELQQADVIVLAVLCGKCADDPATEKITAEKARQLKEEWASIVARQTPPPLEYKTMRQFEEDEAALRTRMIEFLSAL
jgi:hypothetical protein